MKLYHAVSEDISGAPKRYDEAAAKRFFAESLADYLKRIGTVLPAAFASGDWPPVRKGAHGKPYFDAPELAGVFFSISHTRGAFGVCFAEREVGFDCENTLARGGDAARYARIASRCFTDDERRYLAEAQETRFFEIWTAKEAYMKYTGGGFSEGFRTFSSLAPPGDARIETARFADAPHIAYAVCMARDEAVHG